MTRLGVGILGLLLVLATAVGAEDGWEVRKTRHFLIYYKEVPEDFIRGVEDSAERYYEEITEDLGFSRYQSWSYDNRAKIYIYDDKEDYVRGARQKSWSHGTAFARQKIIRTFPSAHGFFDSTLPHELGHIIFREFVGPNITIPLWFEEGVAMYQEKGKRWGAQRVVKKAIEDKIFLSLMELSNVRLSETTNRDLVNLFYAESASIVYYLISELGQHRFVKLCRELNEGMSFSEALTSAYRRFDSVEDLNRTWMSYLKDQ